MSSETDSTQCSQSQRADALARFSSQMREWGLTMPSSDPLVMDFGLADFETWGEIEYWITNEVKAGYCGKYLFVFDGQTCPHHCHGTKHETFFVVKGRARLTLDGEISDMDEGSLITVPPGHVHSFTGLGSALLLELSTPCIISDNEFADPRANEWLKRRVNR